MVTPLESLALGWYPSNWIGTTIEPIKNPVTGDEHRARIVLPDGFEYKEANMSNIVYCSVTGGDQLAFELRNTMPS
jgi:hypothetical protein